MRYIPSYLHEILWSKMPSGGRFSSKPLSCLHCSNCFMTCWPSNRCPGFDCVLREGLSSAPCRALHVVSGNGNLSYGGCKTVRTTHLIACMKVTFTSLQLVDLLLKSNGSLQ